MLWAPSGAEFMINKNRTKFLGTLVGGRMQFMFDAVFTNEDLTAINRLRERISLALTETGLEFVQFCGYIYSIYHS